MASITLIPSGNTGLTNMTIDSSYTIDRAYTDASSTTYARFNINASSTGSIYLTFDTSDIPDGATISSVTARGKARVSNTTRVTNTVMQLYSNTTAKGSNRTFASTTASTQTISAGTWTLSELRNLRLKVGGTGSSSSQSKRIDFYGADVTVTYTASSVPVTGVSLDKSIDSVEVGSTTTLTETVIPSNATNKTVSWSTSDSSVATVSNGVVTGVSAGTARITVTTTEGGYTDYCDVTVTPAVTYTFAPASSMVVGKQYLIADGNSGTVHLLTDESGGSRTLLGVTTTVTDGKIIITGAIKDRTLFNCVRYTSGNDVTITVEKNNKYLYCDNSNGLRTYAPSTLDRFWHFNSNKFWQFKSSSSDGYTDTSSEYKYYLTLNSSNNFTDNHVTTTSIADSTLPAIYIFEEYIPSSATVYAKINNVWVQDSKEFKKVTNTWEEQTDPENIFDNNMNYITEVI